MLQLVSFFSNSGGDDTRMRGVWKDKEEVDCDDDDDKGVEEELAAAAAAVGRR